jgi:hypothetical protein
MTLRSTLSGSLHCHVHADANEKFWIAVTDPARDPVRRVQVTE